MIPKFSNPSEEFKRLNPHVFAEGTLGQVLLEPKDPPVTKENLRLEKQLQVQILNLLRLNGIEPLWFRTDKKTTATVGWPDFTFAVEQGLKSVPIVWEIKLPGGHLSPDQQRMMHRLTDPPNAWVYRVITSVDEALNELRKLGLTKDS